MRGLYPTLLVASVLVVSAFAILPIAPATGQSTSTCPANQTLKVSFLGGSPNSFNHMTANPVGGFGYYVMYYTLYPPANPNGVLDWSHTVTDWVRSNSNFTVWMFNVKPGLLWSDGTPITSNDIIATYSKSFALNASYDLVGAGPEVKSESVLNSSEAQFVLNTPDAHFAEKLSDPVFTGVYPPSFVAKGPGFDGFGTTDVAVGPFYSQNYTSGQSQAVFPRNPHANPLPKACELIQNYPETLSQTPTLLLSGTVDLAPVPPVDVASIVTHPNLHLAVVPFHEATYLRYNVTVFPYSNPAFRQALAFGINQSAILQQAFAGYGSTAYTSEGITPTSAPWYNANQMKYEFNPTQALSLLNSAGIAKGSDGLLHYSNGTAVSVTIFTDTNNPEDPVAATVVSDNLKSLGFTVNVNTVGLGSLIGGSFANANGEQHSILLWTSPGPDFGSSYINSQPAYNANIVPMVPGSTWESPPSAQKDFQGNISVIDTTASGPSQTPYLNNIQAINAQYLPILMLAYPAETWIYSTSTFTNWPTVTSGSILVVAAMLNETTLANVEPISLVTTTTTSTTPSGSSTTTTTTATTTSATAAAADYTAYYVGAAVLAVVVIVGIAWVAMRRRPKPA